MLVCVWHVSELCKKWDVSGGFSSLVWFITDTWKKNVFLWELTSFSYSSKIFPSREDTVMRLIKKLFSLKLLFSHTCHFTLSRFEHYQQYILQHIKHTSFMLQVFEIH